VFFWGNQLDELIILEKYYVVTCLRDDVESSHSTLADIQENREVTVLDLACELSVFRSLVSIGISPGRRIRILINRKKVVLVAVDNSIIALSEDVASRIIVGE